MYLYILDNTVTLTKPLITPGGYVLNPSNPPQFFKSALLKMLGIVFLLFLVVMSASANPSEQEVTEQCTLITNNEARVILLYKLEGVEVEVRLKEVYDSLAAQYPDFWKKAEAFIKAVYKHEKYELVKTEYEAVVKACVKALYKPDTIEM